MSRLWKIGASLPVLWVALAILARLLAEVGYLDVALSVILALVGLAVYGLIIIYGGELYLVNVSPNKDLTDASLGRVSQRVKCRLRHQSEDDTQHTVEDRER